MNKRPRLVVFDLAGTTVRDNHDVQRILRSVLAGYSVFPSPTEVDKVMGIPKPVAIEILLTAHAYPHITPELIADIHRNFISEMILFYRTDPTVMESQGVSETFEGLRKLDIAIAVDTGFDRAITDALLLRMGWQEKSLIDCSVCSDEVSRGRPFPDLIMKAMEVTGVQDSSDVAKVGDTASDVQEGKAAGCSWVIAITTGAFSQADLQRENPTHLIHAIPELLSFWK